MTPEPTPARVTFMLVDDDADGRFFSERSLKKAFPNCVVIACASADAAIERLAEARPDAIVTDNHLGRQTGCEFIAHVRQQGIACPIVMVTCSADPEVAKAALRAGATKVFSADRDEFAEFLKSQMPG